MSDKNIGELVKGVLASLEGQTSGARVMAVALTTAVIFEATFQDKDKNLKTAIRRLTEVNRETLMELKRRGWE